MNGEPCNKKGRRKKERKDWRQREEKRGTVQSKTVGGGTPLKDSKRRSQNKALKKRWGETKGGKKF